MKIMLQAARFSILILLLSLIGCYPAYNWRLVQTDEFGWEALFPAKPNRSTRKINILNRSREMVITIDRYSVLVDDMNFVLDVMNYEGEVSASPGSLQGFINDALKNNFNMTSKVEIVDGIRLDGFVGEVNTKPVVLVLKHLKNNYSLARGAVISTPHSFKNEKAEFFLNSIK